MCLHMVIFNRRIKPIAYVIFVLLIVVLLLLIMVPKSIKLHKLHNSIEYKLSTKGYNNKDITVINTLDNNDMEYILNNEYSSVITSIINSKYFLPNNFKDYIKYHNDDKENDINNIIAYVNTKSYEEEYEEIKQTDTSLEFEMLVNKNNYLNSDYIPDNIVKVSNWYAYEGHKLNKTAYDSFINMFNDAKKDGVSIVLSQGYRSYKDQKSIFNTYKRDYGEKYADVVSTRPGFSEYQTGLALNISKLYSSDDKFDSTKEYKWLIDNSYKYGFILRYPKDKEFITKYKYNPNHFRYVGVEAATIINSENLTLEEYLAYYKK